MTRRHDSAAATRSARRMGWGLADQALSSMTNFAVGIVVARSVSAHSFGIYAIAFALYTMVLTIARALCTDPLVVRHSSTGAAQFGAAARRCTGSALVLGVVSGVVLAGAGLLAGGGFGPLLLVLAVTMPGLLLQDAWRNVFFASGRGAQAFLNDLGWAVLLIPAFVLVHVVGHPSAAALTFAWGSAASAAAVFGIAQARLRPRTRDALRWLRENRQLWPRYLAEALLQTGTQQLVFVVIGAIGGLVVVGQIKLVQIALGPVNVITQGIGIVAVPEAVRALRSGIRRLDRVTVAVSLAVAAGAAVWGLTLAALPQRWTSLVVGDAWTAAAALLLPLSLLQVCNGANTGAYVGLRAFQAAARSLSTRVFASAATLAAATVGAMEADAAGAAYGMCIGSVLSLIAWWLGYVRARSVFTGQLATRPGMRNHPAQEEKRAVRA